jgi:hypothetical protein
LGCSRWTGQPLDAFGAEVVAGLLAEADVGADPLA